MNRELQSATIVQWTWKTPAMRDMTLAVCRLAIERGIGGEFSSLDLPLRGQHAQGGRGIAGVVFRQLKDSGIIARVGAFVEDVFYPRTVQNAGGNPVGVYRLENPGLARALIEAHDPGYERPAVQMEMPIAECGLLNAD